jgi:4-hydroxyphenylpyruvate dioxygenase
MKISMATASLGGELGEKLTAIAQAGFDGVEIFDGEFIASAYSPSEAGKMVRDHGLELVAFQPFGNFEGLPEPQRSKAFDRAERKFDIMGELGVQLMLVCSNLSSEAHRDPARAASDFHELGERAERRGLRIGYEALSWAPLVNDHREAWDIVQRADHPAVGLILNSFHTLAREIDLESIRKVQKEKLFLVQLADAPKLQLDYLSWSRHFRTMPGQGDLDLLGFMRAVQATGYDGVLSLETFNDKFRAGSARMVANDGRRSLIYLMDQLHRGQPSQQIQEPSHSQLHADPCLPPRVQCKAIPFIEFAVSESSARELESLISSLGFKKAGRHLSKNVTLWRQGSANLVLNKEQEGFAHSFYITHGPGACAIGLLVDDAKATVKRAAGLLATPFQQAVHAGELQIPAIRGVGGSLIYFLDQKSELKDVWQVEFIPESVANTADAPPLSIDHIAYSTHYGEMLSWILFFTSIFDLERTRGLEIADPVGLVRSQVVQSPNGAVRIALNSAQNLNTMSNRFVGEFFGSGMHHIAFSSQDIIATARDLKANGLELLPIPPNYYDDLATRFTLPQDLLSDLASFGIMYDRDPSGEYFQLYTRTFDNRFFFEIVERRGYTGFGASNAPVRLATQSRLAPDPSLTRW